MAAIEKAVCARFRSEALDQAMLPGARCKEESLLAIEMKLDS